MQNLDYTSRSPPVIVWGSGDRTKQECTNYSFSDYPHLGNEAIKGKCSYNNKIRSLNRQVDTVMS